YRDPDQPRTPQPHLGPVAQARQDVGRLLALRRFDGGHLHASITIDVLVASRTSSAERPKTRGSPAPVTITSRFASFSKQLVKTLLVGLSLFYEHLGLDGENLDLRKRGESGGRIDVVSKRHVPHV